MAAGEWMQVYDGPPTALLPTETPCKLKFEVAIVGRVNA